MGSLQNGRNMLHLSTKGSSFAEQIHIYNGNKGNICGKI
jgi:hypothetical protein